MENFPNLNQNSSEKVPIENPYFFENDKDNSRKIESTVEKRSLQRVAKDRLEGESYESYKERMGKALSFTFKKYSHDGIEGLVSFLDGKKKRKVNSKDLLPVVNLQNRVLFALAGLKEDDRVDYLIKCRQALIGWIEQEQINDEADVRNIRGMFDGCEAVCNYMDMRKIKHGEDVEFYTDVFLDWKYGIDLVEFQKVGDDEVDIRLVQNKSSAYELDEKVEESIDKHAAWVQSELLGMNDVRDRFARVLEAEMSSEHQESLKEVGGHLFDSSIRALDLIRTEKEGGTRPEVDEFFAGESELSKLAFALSFYEAGDKEGEGLKESYAREVADSSRDDIITGLNVSNIYSVFAVDDIESVEPYRLYSENQHRRELFVGTEPSV